MINHTNVNIAAVAAVVVSAIITIGSCIVCANPAISTVALVIFAVLAVLGCASGWAGIAAWMNTTSGRVSDYAKNWKTFMAIATLGVIQYIAHAFFQELVRSLIHKVIYGQK